MINIYLSTKGDFFLKDVFQIVKRFNADEHISILSYRKICKSIHFKPG